MRILHVIPSFFPAHVYGGPIESVYQLCWSLVGRECEVRVLTTDANGLDRVLNVEKEREVEIARGLHIRYCSRLMRHSVSPTLLRLLASYIRWADVIHLTAAYSFPTIPTLLSCKVLGKPMVWSPQGAFQRWEGFTRSMLKAAWNGVCRAVAPKRLILHVTSEKEARESLERFPGFETGLIPNGIEIPEKVTRIFRKGTVCLLYLGRLHPIKGIENLLAACKMLNGGSGVTWSLIIAGTGDLHYTESIRARIEELTLSQKVKMVGEVVGEAKQRLFQNADIVAVPSYSENFGMVVAEALAHGVPVIASRGTPWKRVEDIGCGLWVDNDPESLAKAIAQMNRMPLREMGQRGRAWMEREFAWQLVAERMVQLYHNLAVR